MGNKHNSPVIWENITGALQDEATNLLIPCLPVSHLSTRVKTSKAKEEWQESSQGLANRISDSKENGFTSNILIWDLFLSILQFILNILKHT